MEQGTLIKFSVHSDGLLKFRTRMFVPNDNELQKEILNESHNTRFIMHPKSTKMYENL